MRTLVNWENPCQFSLHAAIVGLAFAILNLTGCGGSNAQGDAAKTEDVIRAALERIEADFAMLKHEIPKELELQLQVMEAALNDRTRWPQDLDAAESLRRQLQGILDSLSPVAGERSLPRLARLSWGVEALWTFQSAATASPDQAEELHAALDSLLERHLSGELEEIHDALAARSNELETQGHAFRLQQSLERAGRALAGDEDASAAYSSLEEFQENTEAAAILPKLRVRVLEASVLDRVAGLESHLAKVRSLDDARVRRASLMTIQASALGLLVDMEFEIPGSNQLLQRSKSLLAQCDAEVATYAAQERDDNAKNFRRYQAWALSQIREFDSPGGWHYDAALPRLEKELREFTNATADVDWVLFKTFPSAREVVETRLNIDLSDAEGPRLTVAHQKLISDNISGSSGLSWRGNVNTELAYRTTRDGMVKFLLPIQSQLLDTAVAQLYQAAFSKGWQKLEGRDDQLFVAEQSAIVHKKTFEEAALSQP